MPTFQTAYAARGRQGHQRGSVADLVSPHRPLPRWPAEAPSEPAPITRPVPVVPMTSRDRSSARLGPEQTYAKRAQKTHRADRDRSLDRGIDQLCE